MLELGRKLEGAVEQVRACWGRHGGDCSGGCGRMERLVLNSTILAWVIRSRILVVSRTRKLRTLTGSLFCFVFPDEISNAVERQK